MTPRGHHFTWFPRNDAEVFEPPDNASCRYCKVTYGEVKNTDDMHFCLGAWSVHPARIAFVHALQGCE